MQIKVKVVDLIRLLAFLASGLGQFIVIILILAIILPEGCAPFLAFVLVVGFIIGICMTIADFFKE